jgi:hypothetical protein
LQSFKDKSFIADIRSIIEHGRQQAYAADRQATIATFWNVGRRIVEEEQKGESRAAYITRLIHLLVDRLKAEYGDGYGKRNAFFVSKHDLKAC